MQANEAAQANTRKHEKVFGIFNTLCGLEGLVHIASTGKGQGERLGREAESELSLYAKEIQTVS